VAWLLAGALAFPGTAAAADDRLFSVAGKRSASNVVLGPLGGPATEAALGQVEDLVALADGGFVVATSTWGGTEMVLRVNPQGEISRVAGGRGGFSGDGGPATKAGFAQVTDIAAMPDGGLLLADSNSCRVRRIWPSGVITTVAGSGDVGDCFDDESWVDGQQATSAQIFPAFVAPTADGGFLVASFVRVWHVAADGAITSVAGTGREGVPKYGRPARNSPLRGVEGIAATSDGGFRIQSEEEVDRVLPDGRIVLEARNALDEGSLSDDGSLYRLPFRPGRPVERVLGENPRGPLAGGGNPGYFGGDGQPALDSYLYASDAEITSSGELLLVEESDYSAADRILLAAGPATPWLGIAIARESLSGLMGRRLSFRVTRAATVEVELSQGRRVLARLTRRARPGLNTVALPRALKQGVYRATTRAKGVDGAGATDQLRVLVGRSLPAAVARRAVAISGHPFGEDPPPVVKPCRRFTRLRVDCIQRGGYAGAGDPSEPCTRVVAVFLRRGGTVHLRPYGCSRRGSSFRKLPDWRGRAIQSRPLDTLFHPPN
jgi:hypothetical protein